jgi:alanine-alpha-ketoisovalerate/valine-pyruvate aminotransferase
MKLSMFGEKFSARSGNQVLMDAGHYFFPGLSVQEKSDWHHCRECIQISYAQEEATVLLGIQHIAEEVRRSIGRREGRSPTPRSRSEHGTGCGRAADHRVRTR